MRVSARFIASLAASASVLVLAGCASGGRTGRSLPPAGFVSDAASAQVAESYLIGPLDEITIFVWRNAELGALAPGYFADFLATPYTGPASEPRIYEELLYTATVREVFIGGEQVRTP